MSEIQRWTTRRWEPPPEFRGGCVLSRKGRLGRRGRVESFFCATFCQGMKVGVSGSRLSREVSLEDQEEGLLGTAVECSLYMTHEGRTPENLLGR